MYTLICLTAILFHIQFCIIGLHLQPQLTTSPNDNLQPLKHRPAKFGFAVLFPSAPCPSRPAHFTPSPRSASYDDFFFSHVTLIEGHVTRLRRAFAASLTSSASTSTPDGVRTTTSRLTAAVRDLQNAVDDLYSTPRLQEHLWLKSIREVSPKSRAQFSLRFVAEFVSLLDKLETINTNLFVNLTLYQ